MSNLFKRAAIFTVIHFGLKSKNQNPFAYYAAAITNSFNRMLNIENQNLRDDILEMNNLNSSYTRQNINNGGNFYDE